MALSSHKFVGWILQASRPIKEVKPTQEDSARTSCRGQAGFSGERQGVVIREQENPSSVTARHLPACLPACCNVGAPRQSMLPSLSPALRLFFCCRFVQPFKWAPISIVLRRIDPLDSVVLLCDHTTSRHGCLHDAARSISSATATTATATAPRLGISPIYQSIYLISQQQQQSYAYFDLAS